MTVSGSGPSSKPRIAILGAGLAGMAAAKTLRDQDCVVYESRSHSGGHASSFAVGEGFIFDEGPHLSFTPFDRIKQYLAESIENRFLEHPAYATNYFQGAILKHPVQCNLHGLPAELITRCIADFVRAQYEDTPPPSNYKDWCYKGFGKTVSEVFTRPYTRKYWNLELEQLTTDWVSQRIYAPKLEEVLEGALTSHTGQHYYMSTFRYPSESGFGGYSARLQAGTPIRYNSRVVEVDLKLKKLTFEAGDSEHYDHLISTVPVPEFIRLCKDAPAAVREAGEKLVCTSHFLLSVGINRPTVNDAFWTYYYDEDIPFSRASYPSKYSNKTAPQGHSSIQVEVVHSRFKSIPSQDTLVEQCLDAMIKVGLLHSRDEIVALDSRNIRYANVIFDFNRVPNLTIAHDFMKSSDVHWCGRYGEWAYLWTDQSILSGERAANEVRQAIGLEPAQFDQ